MSRRFRRFLGVDFSGARTAGNTIWIAEGSEARSRLVIDRLRRARDLPGGAIDRDTALTALRKHLATLDDALIGLDFPFSLPDGLIDAPDWPAFAKGFAAKYPDPEAFREDCRRRTGGRELKRRTDRETKTPFCAYNLRLYRQTYWGIARLLAPLVEDSRIAVATVLDRPGASCTLAETCPASSLKRLGLYRPYKGRDDGLRDWREVILDWLQAEGVMCGEAFRDTAIADVGGDALDAIIAAATMWRIAEDTREDLTARDRVDRLEARVIAWPGLAD